VGEILNRNVAGRVIGEPVNVPQNPAPRVCDRRTIFLTWRLKGSLPNGFAGSLTADANLLASQEFRYLDWTLDSALCGPVWLRDPRIGRFVAERLVRGQAISLQYELHAFVIMPNHVHMLLTPTVPLRALSDGLKGSIARVANRLLGRRGARFWEDESFGQWVRDGAQFARAKNYIERNPVRAGLVSNPEIWPWSSARPVIKPLQRPPRMSLAG